MTLNTGWGRRKMGRPSKTGLFFIEVVLDMTEPQPHCFLPIFCIYMLQRIPRTQLYPTLHCYKGIVYSFFGGLPSVTSPYLGFS